MNDQDIVDTIAESVRNGLHAPVPIPPDMIAAHVLAALRERYAVVERPEPREVTVLKNAWWLDGDVTAVVGSGRVRCELEDHRLSSDEARALAAALLAAAAEADQ